jgi:hypothetical protein
VDKVGTLRKNRVAAYLKDVPAVVKNFYCFLGVFLKWRPTFKMNTADPEVATEIKMVIHTNPETPLQFESEDQMECPVEIAKDVASQAVSVFDTYPPTFPARAVVLTLEADSQSFVSIVFSGNTQPFRTGFDAEGILRKAVPQANGHSE